MKANNHSNSKSYSMPILHDSYQPRFMIIDDDSVVTTVTKAHLKSYFPDVEIQTTNLPVVEPGFDVYFVDNDFNGLELAASLITQVREIEPQALIVALSTTLDLFALQNLINLGCNAVYNKRAPGDATDARDVINNYVQLIRKQNCESYERPTFTRTIGSLFDLLSQWNQRLNSGSTNYKKVHLR